MRGVFSSPGNPAPSTGLGPLMAAADASSGVLDEAWPTKYTYTAHESKRSHLCRTDSTAPAYPAAVGWPCASFSRLAEPKASLAVLERFNRITTTRGGRVPQSSTLTRVDEHN